MAKRILILSDEESTVLDMQEFDTNDPDIRRKGKKYILVEVYDNGELVVGV